MGVCQIVVVIEIGANGGGRLLLIGKIAGEVLGDLFANVRFHGVDSVFVQIGHIAGCTALAGGDTEQALQVAGDEDVHRGGHGQVERTVAVVGAGGQEIRQNVILVRCANKATDGKPHQLCQITGKNIAEITGRHTHIHGLAHLQCTARQKITVRRDVVHDLRSKTSPVDGIRARENITTRLECLGHISVSEDNLNACLRIVKITADRSNLHVLTGLSGHLQLLHAADAVYRVEHHDFDVVNILVPFKCGLAGITGCGDKDQGILFLAGLHQGTGKKAGHDLKCHVLKRSSRAMPKLECVNSVMKMNQRCSAAREGCLGICQRAIGEQFFIGVVREKLRKDLCGTNGVGVTAEILQICLAQGRNGFRQKEAAIGSKAHFDDLSGCVLLVRGVAGALIEHNRFS